MVQDCATLKLGHILFGDLKFAFRSLRKAPAFTAVAILVVALGVGANTAIFSVVDAVLLRALPYRDPARLVMLWEANPAAGGFLAQRLPVCLRNYAVWKSENHSYSSMGLFQTDEVNLLGREKPERIRIGRASIDFFSVLGVAPTLGRTFSSAEGEPGSERVVVLSEEFFQKHFGADSRVLGTTVTLSGKAHTIVGVLPGEFELPAFWEGLDQKKAELWLPLNTSTHQPEADLTTRDKYVFARLKPGVSLQDARAEMEILAHRLQTQYPDFNKRFTASVFPLQVEDVGPDLRRNVLVLQYAVGFVLLIACANVANLLLTRASAREKELAIRLALGAGRNRLIRQMLTESFLLSLAGGATGLVLGYWGMRLIEALAPVDVHNLHEMHFDTTVLGFAVLLILLTGLLFGLAPSLHASRQNVNAALAQGGRAGIGGHSRLRSVLVVAEVALALVLLIGAGLMIRSLRAVMSVDPGFRSHGVLKMEIALSPEKYPKPENRRAFCRTLSGAVGRLPGVQSVALASGLPLQNIRLTSFDIEGAPASENARPRTDYQFVTESYFETMGSRILRGRSFTAQEADEPNPRVVVISESLAKQYWPGGDPLGNAITMGGPGDTKRFTIVGIAGDTHQLGLDAPSRPELYMPSRDYRAMCLVVRCSVPPMRLTRAITDQIYALDREQPVTDIVTMDELVRGSAEGRRFSMILLSVFAGLALVLASVGLYGVLAYSVAQRTREIGIRMALGANAENVVRQIVGQGLMLTASGITIGLLGAAGLTRLMSSLIFGISANDPTTFALIATGLTAVSVLASYLPARRASRIDPIEALRLE